MKFLLSLFFLVFMSLVNANDIAVSSGIEHCSLDSKSMNMSVEEHLSGCCDTVCAQHLSIDKKVVISERVIPQSLSVAFISNTFYTSFSSKVILPPPIV